MVVEDGGSVKEGLVWSYSHQSSTLGCPPGEEHLTSHHKVSQLIPIVSKLVHNKSCTSPKTWPWFSTFLLKGRNSKLCTTTDKHTFGKSESSIHGECLYSESRSLSFITLGFSPQRLKKPGSETWDISMFLKIKFATSIRLSTAWPWFVFCFETFKRGMSLQGQGQF